MRSRLPIALSASLALVAACGAAEPRTAATPTAATTAATPEPTREEKENAKDREELRADRARWQEVHARELARWTPALHAAAAALSNTAYATARPAILAAMASPHRRPSSAARDKYRHPLETLELFGLTPTMTVLEVGPGDGWYTELLAPVLAARGKLLATSGDPAGPVDERPTFLAQRYRDFLATAPEVYGRVQTVLVDGIADAKRPRLDAVRDADMALLMREVHGMINGGTLDAWLAELHAALKPGGILGIEEHRAPPDADPHVSAWKGYVPEKWLIERVEAAGFALAGKSEVNANPKDTKDYPEGVWTLPPSLQLGEKDRDKYVAIGESDRMTLKFVKVVRNSGNP